MTSTSKVSHVKITTASLIALATTIVGALCAIVPQLAPDQQIIIAALTAVITTVGLVANAIHAVAGAKLSVAVAEQDVKNAVQAELQRILTKGLDSTPPVPPVSIVPPDAAA